MSDHKKKLQAFIGETASELFDAIKHGDEGHQKWLKDAIVAFFAGTPAPEYMASEPAETEAWLIEFGDKHGYHKRVFMHNCIGDFRMIDGEAVSTELVKRN